MFIRAAAASDCGRVRVKNDDHYCLGTLVEQTALTALTVDAGSTFFRDYGLLAAVADGMGGYQGGDYASRLVLETLSALYYGEKRAGCEITDLAKRLEEYLSQTQRMLARALERHKEYGDAGTTLAGLALMPPDYMVVFHAGDSRVLRGCAGYVRALTIDHTPVGADVDAGLMSEEQAASRPEAHQLTLSLGSSIEQKVPVNIDFAWTPGETFLIGSDGFYGLGCGLPKTVIRDALRLESRPEPLARALIERAVAMDGEDNATVVVIAIEPRQAAQP
jgi:protein phosphatase